VARHDQTRPVSDKSEQWAWQRIRELEHRIHLLQNRVSLLRRSRDLWREKAIERRVKRVKR
jgi:hypothetical protein